MDATAAAIADPTRRQVLELVRDRELAAGEIAGEFEISRPAVSRHLRVLRGAGLVRERRAGRLRLYRADPKPLEEVRSWLNAYWSERLAALKTLAEEGTMTETVLAPVVCTVEIAAPREHVFELFTVPERLVEWWPDAATFEAREGGHVHLEFDGRGEVSGTVTHFDPPNALGFTWVRGVAPDVVTQVDVELTELEDGGTLVVLTHAGWEAVPEDQVAEWREIHDAGWRHFLGLLRDLAEGRPVDKTAQG